MADALVAAHDREAGATARVERYIVWTAVAIGIAYRLYVAAILPVGYDEVYVMAVGLEDMAESSAAWAFEVPATRSSALTPLWWWMQYIPFALLGDISLFGLRFVPAILGVASIPISYALCRCRFGCRPAAIFVVFVALSDILAFTNGRGEFAESMAFPCIVAGMCLLGQARVVWLRAAVWLLLIGLSLGKGLFVIALMLVADTAILLVSSGERRRRVVGLAFSLLIVALPVTAYLVAVDSVFEEQSLIHHEAADAHTVFELARRLTLDYSQVKAHVVGSAADAALVWHDFGVWPTTVLSVLPLVGGLAWGVSRLCRSGFRNLDPQDSVIAGLIVWAAVGCMVVVGRGTLGARFHLMYLPALWLLGALWLASLSPRVRLVSLATGVAACFVAMLVAGPIRWAPCARFEPMAGSEEMAAFDAYRRGETALSEPHGRTLFIDLANYHLKATPSSQEHLERALHYARREAQRVPDDPRAWAYVGEALRRQGADPDEIRKAWQRSLDLAPNETLERKLKDLP